MPSARPRGAGPFRFVAWQQRGSQLGGGILQREQTAREGWSGAQGHLQEEKCLGVSWLRPHGRCRGCRTVSGAHKQNTAELRLRLWPGVTPLKIHGNWGIWNLPLPFKVLEVAKRRGGDPWKKLGKRMSSGQTDDSQEGFRRSCLRAGCHLF